MSGIPLQSGIIYGPILSRRLGRSLGINLLPADRKVCSFDCIYCQYGATRELTSSPPRSTLPKPTEVFSAVEKALRKPRTVDFVTFSGNGEPTIHPDFPEIVRGVRAIVDRLRPEAKLAILSNASRVNDPEVAAALRLIDALMMKLDAGDEESFQAINRPRQGISLDAIVDGLKTLPHLTIQTGFLDGEITNASGEAYEGWATLLDDIRPQVTHIYSMERPTAHDSIQCVSSHRLTRIAVDMHDRYGLTVLPFSMD